MDEKYISRASDESLNNLCRRVEETYGKTVRTPLQFEALADDIVSRVKTRLSPTTLKRLWGYLNEPMTPRRSTLDILAQYCGWRDYEDFLRGDHPEIDSGSVGANVISTSKNINPGERVRLTWKPSRVCLIEYLGGMRWRVVESVGTRLSPGDTFTCTLIVAGEPLYLDNLIHDNSTPGTYVCGRRSGIAFYREP